MKNEEVRARLGREGDHTICTYPFGENLDELIEQFGGEIVYKEAKASIVISLQAFMRSWMKPDEHGNTLSLEELQQKVDAWKPGLRARGKTTAEKAADLLGKLTDAQKAELFEQLRDEIDDD